MSHANFRRPAKTMERPKHLRKTRKVDGFRKKFFFPAGVVTKYFSLVGISPFLSNSRNSFVLLVVLAPFSTRCKLSKCNFSIKKCQFFCFPYKNTPSLFDSGAKFLVEAYCKIFINIFGRIRVVHLENIAHLNGSFKALPNQSENFLSFV